MGAAGSTQDFTLPEAQGASIEYFQVIMEGTAYGRPSGMHHSIIFVLDNGHRLLVEKVNPHFEQNPFSTCGDIHINLDQEQIENRLDKADVICHPEEPHVRCAQTIIARAVRMHDGHYSLLGDNCQDFVRDVVQMMDG